MKLIFSHKGLEKLYTEGSHAGVNPQHVQKLKRTLFKLASSKHPQDMNVPGWGLHPLSGNYSGYSAVTISGNWRLIFKFDVDEIKVDYVDYH